jgi:hypothetical protein
MFCAYLTCEVFRGRLEYAGLMFHWWRSVCVGEGVLEGAYVLGRAWRKGWVVRLLHGSGNGELII